MVLKIGERMGSTQEFMADPGLCYPRKMTPPAGTFLAKVRDGVVQLPPPLKRFCDASDWTLFRVVRRGENHLEIQPILADDISGISDEFQSSLSREGGLWIPAPVRALVGLGEQSVMMRAENGAIHIYLRKVFETLGFGP
jgi:hypothetical protein